MIDAALLRIHLYTQAVQRHVIFIVTGDCRMVETSEGDDMEGQGGPVWKGEHVPRGP